MTGNSIEAICKGRVRVKNLTTIECINLINDSVVYDIHIHEHHSKKDKLTDWILDSEKVGEFKVHIYMAGNRLETDTYLGYIIVPFRAIFSRGILLKSYIYGGIRQLME